MSLVSVTSRKCENDYALKASFAYLNTLDNHIYGLGLRDKPLTSFFVSVGELIDKGGVAETDDEKQLVRRCSFIADHLDYIERSYSGFNKCEEPDKMFTISYCQAATFLEDVEKYYLGLLKDNNIAKMTRLRQDYEFAVRPFTVGGMITLGLKKRGKTVNVPNGTVTVSNNEHDNIYDGVFDIGDRHVGYITEAVIVQNGNATKFEVVLRRDHEYHQYKIKGC